MMITATGDALLVDLWICGFCSAFLFVLVLSFCL